MPEFEILKVGVRGDGIAEGPVYVPGTLPGERIEGEPSKGRIAAPKILHPVSDRVRAPCVHNARCGGCVLQHASDAFVADWKLSQVRDALASVGLSPLFRPVHTSPRSSRRRATFAARRTKSGALVGFHTRASDTIVPVPDCLVISPALTKLLPGLEDLTRSLGSRRSVLSFAATETVSGIELDVSGAPIPAAERQSDLVSWASDAGLARLTWNGELVAGIRPAFVRFGPCEVDLPPGAFLQATQDGEAALLTAVREAVGDARTVADLFAGCGTFALSLADRNQIDAFEGDAAMVAAMDAGRRAAGGGVQVRPIRRDLFRQPLLPDELKRYDAVVIDPPRAGAEAQFRELAEASVPRIAAVSCNPTTFARDASILGQAGYRLHWVQVVDQFRWSAHIELAAHFTLDHIAP